MKGRPVLGVIAGLFLGLFVWLDLLVFGVVSLDSVMFWVLPILGALVGLGAAATGAFSALRR